MNTSDDLKKIFNDRFPKVVDVAARYMNVVDTKTVNIKAAKGEFGFPVFKAIDSNKAPWLVDTVDLAQWLNSQAKTAKNR